MKYERLDKVVLEEGMKKRNKQLGETWEDLNDRLGKPFVDGSVYRSFMKNHCKRATRGNRRVMEYNGDDKVTNEGDKPANGDMEVEIEILKSGEQISKRIIEMSEADAKDTEFLLKAHGYDPDVWEILTARSNFWNTYSKKDGILGLYASRIMVKPKISGLNMDKLAEHFTKFSREYKTTTEEVSMHYTPGGKLLEINLCDLHFAKLCHYSETGNNYDYKIATNRYMQMIYDIYHRVKGENFEKILFIMGNDFFNTSTIDDTTIHGTKQDNDLRWSKMFTKGCELLIRSIDILRELGPMEILYIEGNHDLTVSFYALNYLYAWYRNTKDMLINTDPIGRKYVEFGKCLIGFAHGDTERNNIFKVMQVEVPEAWGRTIFREMHLGHIHHELVREDGGVIVRSLPSITGTDKWHYKSGFVGNLPRVQSFIWGKDTGLDSIIYSCVKE